MRTHIPMRSRLISGMLGLAVAVGLGVSAGVATELTTATPQAAQAASTEGGYIKRSEVLARAQNWVDRGIIYGTNEDVEPPILEFTTDAQGKDYRQDCSGLVSMAWHLTSSPTTVGFAAGSANTSSVSSPDAMLPADAVLFDGHIELFAEWKNPSDHTQGAWSYSLNGPYHADWAKGPTVNSHGDTGTLSWSDIVNNRRLRYNKILDDTVSGTANIYGVLPDGRLTFSTIDAASGNRTKTVVSTTSIGFTPKAMATLNFNTILMTDTASNLYRIDVIANNTSLVYNAPVKLASGWTHELLTYDGNSHLFGISNGTLRRYTVSVAKPAAANISTGQLIGTGFALNNLAATASNWLIGTTSAGRLLSYKIDSAGNWTGNTLATDHWFFDAFLSPGAGVYYGKTPAGGMYRYLDADPFDSTGTDIQTYTTDPVDTTGWTQTLLSAQPYTISGS
ncbi:hypothetical protein DFJ67_0911 [Asanoa ferruginea]|uniref:Tachylectin n=1 Tax=Asanoa ferruginea TaxID=53367 RepID=A0A3D9ZEL7_9ACTN|nr:hypothetical protein [Asanoa ferruginea]REF94964.1 hypothetical protein DFJ67_0911 [Asanoa ferruginea]GIF48773.1 hypothetical protein Afe04nite_33120 [Asanoa ferruginea]